MWMWMLLLITVFAGLCAGIVYLTIAVSRFGAIQSLAREKKRWSRLFALILILAGLLIATLTLSFVNAVFMFLHVAGFFLLAALIMRIIRHFTDRPFKIYLQGWIALAASVVTLSAGFYLCTHVWKTEYFLETSKAGAPVKAALFSDSHLGSTFDGAGLEKYVREIEQESVDILLIPVISWTTRRVGRILTRPAPSLGRRISPMASGSRSAITMKDITMTGIFPLMSCAAL